MVCGLRVVVLAGLVLHGGAAGSTEDAILRRDVTLRQVHGPTSLEQRIGGEGRPWHSVTGRTEEVTERRVFTDVYDAADGFVRRFEMLRRSRGASVSGFDSTGDDSLLEGCRVRFERGAGPEVQAVRFVGDRDGDPAWLKGLRATWGWRELVPDDRSEGGEASSSQARIVAELFDPGGNLFVDAGEPWRRVSDASMDLPEPKLRLRDLLEPLEGDVRVSHTGRRTDGGRDLDVFDVCFDLAFRGELPAARNDHGPDVEQVSIRADVAMEGEGELTWDAERGVVLHSDIRADLSFELELGWQVCVGSEPYVERRVGRASELRVVCESDRAAELSER